MGTNSGDRLNGEAATVEEVADDAVVDLRNIPSENEPDNQGPDEVAQTQGFSVMLEEFAGPFDLLLSLIAKHKLEVTELALHQVTDDFISHIRDQGQDWDLEEATSFLVVAATLLDLKAARLLPSGEVEDPEDLALLEARDLLFARLLQYKAFKEVSAIFAEQMEAQAKSAPRMAGIDPEFTSLLPDLVMSITPEKLAELAANALEPKQVQEVATGHVHSPVFSVAEQVVEVSKRLGQRGSLTFSELIEDAEVLGLVVARFLSLLELFRQRRVEFSQPDALGELIIEWVEPATDSISVEVSVSEFDLTPEELAAQTAAVASAEADARTDTESVLAHGSSANTDLAYTDPSQSGVSQKLGSD